MPPVAVSLLVRECPADCNQTVAAHMELVRVGCGMHETLFIIGLTGLCAKPGWGMVHEPHFRSAPGAGMAEVVAAAMAEVPVCHMGAWQKDSFTSSFCQVT